MSSKYYIYYILGRHIFSKNFTTSSSVAEYGNPRNLTTNCDAGLDIIGLVALPAAVSISVPLDLNISTYLCPICLRFFKQPD